MPIRSVRRRYLVFRAVSERRFLEKEILDAIENEVLRLYGVLGLSQIAPQLIEFDEERQEGILRCSHQHLMRMRASLASITRIYDSPASIHVEKASGTIKKLRVAKR